MRKLLILLILTILTTPLLPQSIIGRYISKEVKWQKEINMDPIEGFACGDKIILAQWRLPVVLNVFSNTGELLYEYILPKGGIDPLAISGDGEIIAAASTIDESLYKIRIHDIRKGIIDSIELNTPNIKISPNGKYLVTWRGTSMNIPKFALYDLKAQSFIELDIPKGYDEFQNAFVDDKLLTIMQYDETYPDTVTHTSGTLSFTTYALKRPAPALITLHDLNDKEIEKQFNIKSDQGEPIVIYNHDARPLFINSERQRIMFLGDAEGEHYPETILLFDYDLNKFLQKKIKLEKAEDGIQSAALLSECILFNSLYRDGASYFLLDQKGGLIWRLDLGLKYSAYMYNAAEDISSGKIIATIGRESRSRKNLIIDSATGKLIDVEEKSLVISDTSGVRAVVKDGILY